MYHEVLESAGLTPNEAKIYAALLELKSASIGEISTQAQIHRRNAYDAIRRLLEKGLCFQVLPKKTLTYAPVHPDKLRELVDEKALLLQEAMPGLVRSFSERSASQAVFVYKGIGGLKNYISLELEVGEAIYGIGSKGSWFDPRIANFAKHAAKKYAALRTKSKIIYDAEMASHQEVLAEIGGEYKFLPAKYSTGSSIDIFGDYVALYSGMRIKELGDDIAIFILKDKTLAEDHKKWWQYLWDTLPKEG